MKPSYQGKTNYKQNQLFNIYTLHLIAYQSIYDLFASATQAAKQQAIRRWQQRRQLRSSTVGITGLFVRSTRDAAPTLLLYVNDFYKDLHYYVLTIKLVILQNDIHPDFGLCQVMSMKSGKISYDLYKGAPLNLYT